MNKQQKPNLIEWTFLVLITESLVALLYFWLILGSSTVANVMLAVTAALVLILSIIVLVRSSFFPNWAAWGGVVFGVGMLISYYLDADLIPNLSAILIPIIALGVAAYLRWFFKHEEEREQRDQQELQEVRHENERLFAQAGNVRQLEPTDATVMGEQVKSDAWLEQR